MTEKSAGCKKVKSENCLLCFLVYFSMVCFGANCTPEISKIYYKLCREHQNCAPKISVARYKLSRLEQGHPTQNESPQQIKLNFVE